MEAENPYRPPPPRGDEQEDLTSQNKSERPVYDTRWQAARAGIWRGAVLGMKTMCLVLFLLWSFSLVGILFGLIPRGDLFEDWMFFCFQFVASIIGIFAFGFIYGAFPGGIIMGVIEAIRFRKPK